MKLIIVSDIFEHPKAQNCISTLLTNLEHVEYLSLNQLCQTPYLSGDALHQHLFENDGIETVAHTLQAHSDPNTIAVGYSAGGTALWRAVQAGMKLKALFCVSSTRLRELGPISPFTHTYFGSLDTGKPNKKWLAKTPTKHFTFEDAEHNFYNDISSSARKACQIIATDIAHFDTQYTNRI
jgi:dienelactone hydrolase